MDRKVKIVATLGPSSQSPETIRRLMISGMDVARLNFSHGSHEEHKDLIRNLRAAANDLGFPLAILQDLQGPKIRVGKLDAPLDLKPGGRVGLFALGERPKEVDVDSIPVDFVELFDMVHGGERILLDDGRIELKVDRVIGELIYAEVKSGGRLTSHKGINLPGIPMNIRGFTEKDKNDLALGLSQNIDLVAISFVRSPQDVEEVRIAINSMAKGEASPLLIAKLERPEALENLQAILEKADGVMVARGDLGVEIPPERVPTAQKRIIYEANRSRKIVITATQMLESMIDNPLPTRAEASDVANAVFDGTDAVMLSGETASGKYPVESVQMMERIIREAEGNFPEWGHYKAFDSPSDDDADAVSRAACELAHDLNVAAIAVFTQTGRTARLMSKMRPQVPIFAFTPSTEIFHQLSSMWGVKPVHVPMEKSLEAMVNSASRYLLDNYTFERGKQVVIIGGYPVESVRPPNMALLHTLGDVL